MTTAITPEAAERVVAALPGDHRWEITPEGNLVVRPPATGRQAKIVMQLAAWFIRDGIDPVCRLPDVGIRTIGEGLRGPDLAVFNVEPDRDGLWASTNDLAVVIEVFSPSTRRTDEGDKVDEYARIVCPQYWTVEPLDNGDALVAVRAPGEDRRYQPGRSRHADIAEPWTALPPEPDRIRTWEDESGYDPHRSMSHRLRLPGPPGCTHKVGQHRVGRRHRKQAQDRDAAAAANPAAEVNPAPRSTRRPRSTPPPWLIRNPRPTWYPAPTRYPRSAGWRPPANPPVERFAVTGEP